jgi:Sulfotransferase family
MQSVVVFVHIPKCGGTTFNGVLQSLYGDAALLHSEVSNATPEQLSNYQAVSSHFRYERLYDSFGARGIYLSLLREPLENFVSFFNDITQRPAHYLYDRVRDMDIEQFFRFLDDTDHPVVRNRQCLHICNSGDYLLAREYIEARYTLVAPLEYFDEFVLRFCKLVGKLAPQYELANVSVKKLAADALPLAFRQRLYNRNSGDLRLYNFVRERFLLAASDH